MSLFTTLVPDRSIVLSVLNAFRGVIGGGLISLLIATHFSKETQGYHYTFLSLLGLQVFAEMGLGTVVLQFASHEWAGLKWEGKKVAGDEAHRARLASLSRLVFRWYACAGVACFLLLALGGAYFFTHGPSGVVDWVAPWLVLCAFTSCRFCFTPCFSLLEGCGRQNEVYAYRLYEGISGLAVSAVAILLGAGLWTVALSSATIQLVCAAFIFGRQRSFLMAISAPVARPESISWKADLLPMQWRIALSWMAGYFIFQLITPILFQHHGPVVAGQVGLTLSLANAINSLAITWLFTRVPTFGRLIALRQWRELDALAWRAGASAVGVAAAGVLLAWLGLWVLGARYPEIAARFLPPWASLGFLITVVIQQVAQTQAYYLRSFRREPLMIPSMVSAAFTAASVWLLSRYSGPGEVGWGYCAVAALIGLPLCTYVFIRARREWQAAVPA